ncbi:MAG: Adenine phosphoribosyltransferase [Candidatus Moranbacteria bacterium GW2011_GWE1_35_17]|nr:MAG: Adenine phosphoribosyltransferase [Candidatus Moranbacteria bacterium GW2011_GWE1_35_17]KKP72863.1 MAG: Adenine phosphoribosyltransferase [Candidatus Moranbacteria bacterium GW2011_GWE2_35_164]KKP84084.1 MAG: Adenine phosphoribosyltransferase [Candidatus Moranbacteria bacterium GW2011_GWF1_35_5]KKP85036.1 MAG: Adenine phosphoribosyltransferase [Candidatus Moranbacteria bacterium GW2011_GWF2_35_54]
MSKNKIEKVFGRSKIFLPVIHVLSKEQTLRNVAVAVEARADGVFLINHNIHAGELISVFRVVKKKNPNLWIGINFLDLYREDSAKTTINIGADGLWTDDAGVHEGMIGAPIARNELLGNWKGLYFGGVAFKYQRAVTDVATVAKLALNVVDVVTTSGARTGAAPNVDKISTMREAIGDFPIAIASGITVENVRKFIPYNDCFLVATGISFSHTELNPEKTQLLSSYIHNWKS